MQRKKGISLIVLVITIIVMIILAGTIVLSLNSTDIMDRAEEAVNKTDLKTIQTLASTLWAEAYMDGKTEQPELKEAVINGLTAQGINISNYTITVTAKGVTVKNTINHNGTKIPEGATYTTSDGSILYAGDEFPDVVTTGDVYMYEDYTYTYNQNNNGWGVKVTSKDKSTYGLIIEKINGALTTSMAYTFDGCSALTILPDDFKIPDSVTSMSCTFEGCKALTTLPDDFEVPENVTNMYNTFYNCSVLADTITIHANPSKYKNCFYGCNMTNIQLVGDSNMLSTLADTVNDDGWSEIF